MSLIKSKRKLKLLLIDLAIIISAYLMTVLFLTLSNKAFEEYALLRYAASLSLFAIALYGARFALGVYGNVWRYANAHSFAMLVIADALGGSVALFITYIKPINFITIGAWQSLSFVAMADLITLMSRFVYQLYYRNHR